jgi:hypothetical protein
MDAHQVIVAAGKEGIGAIGQIDNPRRLFRHWFSELGAYRG